jgi:uncharacterized membrane protein YoaK (UPF0700 family)
MFQERTPLWIGVGGVLLTLIAGWVNAVGVLGAFHQALTHVTGTVTRAAISFGGGDLVGAGRAAAIVAAFVGGAVVAGVVVGSPEARRGASYSLALANEAALLGVAWLFLARGSIVGELAAAAAAGLQNGLVTTWSGAVLRTSHVTGIATDVGLAIGWSLRRRPLHGRFLLHTSLLGGFFAGGVVGSAAWSFFGWAAMAGPIALCLLAAGTYAAATTTTATTTTTTTTAPPP